MIKLYTTHCPECRVVEFTLKNKMIPYEIIDDKDLCLQIAEENKIYQMPFAKINGMIYDKEKLKNYISNYQED